MTPKELRMRCIESIASGGIREPQRLIRDAMALEDWVKAAPDKDIPPQAETRKPKADKA